MPPALKKKRTAPKSECVPTGGIGDEEVEDVYVASTQRASRAARSPPASVNAQIAAWQRATLLAGELEAKGLERVGRLPPTTFQPRTGGGRGGIGMGRGGRGRAQ